MLLRVIQDFKGGNVKPHPRQLVVSVAIESTTTLFVGEPKQAIVEQGIIHGV